MSAKQKLSPLRSRRCIFPRLLAVFFFAASPIVAHADALEDGARALARKVAADGKKDLGLSYTWENRSSVSSSTSERMRAAFEEELKGSIQPGQLADVVVLTQDPFKVDPSELLKIQVERTMVGGIWKYES